MTDGIKSEGRKKIKPLIQRPNKLSRSIARVCHITCLGGCPSRGMVTIGAVQDMFWDPSGQDNASRFCYLLEDELERDACYGTIFERAGNVLNKEELGQFCAKAEEAYQQMCIIINE